MAHRLRTLCGHLLLSAALGVAQTTSDATASASSSATPAGAKPQPASFKIIGVVLAIGSGLFIGSSFVFKKKGLLSAQAKAGATAGEGHSYLKSPLWWTGMTLMIVGEILNFVAYAFTEAILVTPLGALSVVICAILSSIFLKEKLTFFGKIGCLLCILGATVIALNGPQEQTTSTIPEFQKLFLSPGFLVFGSLVILTSLGLIFFVAPKYGKTNMLVYISICSLIGGLSVATTQGLGSSILTSIRGDNQFKHWFMYFLLGFVIITLLTEINYLNKALELFNTAMVTPTYYVLFTGCTLITSVILYQGFKASAVDIVTVVIGFVVICCGITLLQLSKVDPLEIKEKLDRKSTILLSAGRSEAHDGDTEKALEMEDPGIDTLRGGFGAIGSIHRAISSRKSMSRTEGSFDPSEIVRRRRGHQAVGSEVGLMDPPSDGMGMGVVRHQLYDKPMPMPDNYADKISLHSGPPTPSASLDASSRPRSTTLTFAANDVVHRYGPKSETIHEQRPFEAGHHVHSSSTTTPHSADVGMESFSALPTSPSSDTHPPATYPDPYNSSSSISNRGDSLPSRFAGQDVVSELGVREGFSASTPDFGSDSQHPAAGGTKAKSGKPSLPLPRLGSHAPEQGRGKKVRGPRTMPGGGGEREESKSLVSGAAPERDEDEDEDEDGDVSAGEVGEGGYVEVGGAEVEERERL